MADDAREWTDEELEEIEAELDRIYRDSQASITAEWNAYMARTATRLSALWFAYQNAPDDEKENALKKYQDAVQNQTLRNKQYKRMADATAYRLAHVNQIAADYVNGKLPSIYGVNYKQLTEDVLALNVPSITSAWEVRSEETMRRLALGEVKLPTRKIAEAKDVAWNLRQLNSSVLQGVLQGESIPQIKKRLLPIVDNNAKSAVRAARTMVTAAENGGRMDSYVDLDKEGVALEKVWIATPDERVREWHLAMDGQQKPIDKPFVDGNGEELMFPGDTSKGASGRTIWNCRCSMRSQIVGFKRADGSISRIKPHEHAGLHQRQISAEKSRREEQKNKRERG